MKMLNGKIIYIYTISFVLLLFSCSLSIPAYSQGEKKSDIYSSRIMNLRNYFDAIQYSIPSLKSYSKYPKKKRIIVKEQSQWENLATILKEELKHGEENIEIIIKGKSLIILSQPQPISGLNYPNANIRIVGNNVKFSPEGYVFAKKGKSVVKEKFIWSVPYTDFDLNDIIVDKKGNEIPLRGEVKLVEGDILKVESTQDCLSDLWKFKIDLPDMTEEQCEEFYVLMTRDWTSARHKVYKVQDGWLYYHLDSKDLHSSRNPNVDWLQYGVRPRYCLINCPTSNGIHIMNGRLYVPKKYSKVRINKGGMLLHMGACSFNSFDISGFILNALGNRPAIGVYHCAFKEGMFIHHNNFTNLSSYAVSSDCNSNIIISDNTIKNTRVQAIECGGKNNTVCRNHLINIGWMLNTRAITGGGECLHICDNVIENFNYGAIACGSKVSNEEAPKLTYIIERNIIRLTSEFTDNYIQNTLADGGGIYIGPQCTQGIIRNNVIENIKGIHSNRGIFLDDGAKNLAIYGNLIINTANSYDIDLRLCNGNAAGIPDHNTNNSIFQNIMTGGYRFQDAGVGSNCIGGENVLLGTGPSQKTVVDLRCRVEDVTESGLDLEKAVKKVPVEGFVGKRLKHMR